LALYAVFLLVDETLPHYLDAWWGLAAAAITPYERLAAQLLRNISTTSLNAYIATPFMTMIFGLWLRREDDIDNAGKKDGHQPWIFLSDGTESIVVKAMIFVTFYGGMAVAWYLQKAY
jgi:hypothetical protein